MNIPKYIKDAWDTGLLKPISLSEGEFSLIGTDYIAIVRKDGVRWNIKKAIPIREPYGKGFGRSSGPNRVSIHYITVPFDKVFDNCPKTIQEWLIYHLDIFVRQETMKFGEVTINPQFKLNCVEIALDAGEKDE